jgi:hypothetical protein
MSSAVLRNVLLASIVCNLGCEDRHPSAPSASAAGSQVRPAPPGVFTLSGIVYESTRDGRRPLAGIPLDISVDYQSRSPMTATDAEGRYRFSGSSSDKLNVRVQKEGYSQPCRSAVALSADSVMDVYVVADETLAAGGVPPSMPVIQPTLSGTVFERGAQGVRPLQDIRLTGDFSAGIGWGPSATTITDANGRYLLCGVDGVLGLELFVQRRGQPNRFVPVDIRTTTRLDIDLSGP